MLPALKHNFAQGIFITLMRKPFNVLSLRTTILLACLLPVMFYLLLPLRYLFFPDVGRFATVNPATTSFIKFRQEQWTKKGTARSVKLSWVSYQDLPKSLVDAIIATEDAGFWKHHGFDFAAMRYAFEANLRSNSSKFGASTISQQLAKNLFLNPSKSITRKVSEAILTWRLEHSLSKKRIIEIYCNCIEWGDGVFGIRQAASHYYQKQPQELTDAEIARLVAVIPGPLRYQLHSNSRYLAKRTEIILGRMHRKSSHTPSTKLLPIDTSESAPPVATQPAPDTLPQPDTGGSPISTLADSTATDTATVLPDVNQ